MFSHGRSEVEEEEMDDPDARGRAISAMDLDVQKLLDSQAAMEEITENRFLSLERLIAFYVKSKTLKIIPKSLKTTLPLKYLKVLSF